ncbi:MAG: nuclear transport factor 2 family protein [Acidobacteriota bacterium]
MRVLILGLLLGLAPEPPVTEPPATPQPATSLSADDLPAVVLPAGLARVLEDYESAWRRGDGAGLAALFDEKGFVLGNGSPPVRGRGAIRAFYNGPGGPLVLRAFAFATDGSIGYILGGFSREAGKPDIGKFTLTLRKSAGGRWLIFSDMDNGNRPRG